MVINTEKDFSIEKTAKEFKDKKKVTKVTEEKGLKLLSLSETLKNGITPIKWRVDKLIPERGVTFLGGTAGSFKTWSAMDIAVCVATGKPYLNYFDVEKCSVLYVDEENGDITIPNRFEMLKHGHLLTNKDLKNIHLSIMNDVQLDTLKGIEKLEEAIKDNQFKVIVIDSMVRCMQGEENSASDVRKVFNNIKNIIHEYKDVSFIILHHTSKGSKGMDGLRGSGDFAASADTILMFNGNKTFINVDIAKNRHIDRSDFNKFTINVDNIANGGIVFSYGENKGYKDATDKCCQDLEIWFKGVENGQPIVSFEFDQAWQEMSRRDHKKTTYKNSINLLNNNGKISRLKKGLYNVVSSTLVDEEY